MIEKKVYSWKVEDWVERYIENLPEQVVFEIKAMRYLDRRTPSRISKELMIPMRVVTRIIQDKFEEDDEDD